MFRKTLTLTFFLNCIHFAKNWHSSPNHSRPVFDGRGIGGTLWKSPPLRHTEGAAGHPGREKDNSGRRHEGLLSRNSCPRPGGNLPAMPLVPGQPLTELCHRPSPHLPGAHYPLQRDRLPLSSVFMYLARMEEQNLRLSALIAAELKKSPPN